MQRYDTYRKVGKVTSRSAGVLPVLLIIGYILLAYLSNFSVVAESYFSTIRSLPIWSLYVVIGLFLVLGFGGGALTKVVESWQWEEAGRKVGLTPVEEELPRDFSYDLGTSIGKKAVLSGRVQGRPVRARAYTVDTSSHVTEGIGGGGGTNYTVIEADLNRAAQGGVIVNLASGGFTDSAEGGPDAQDGELAAISNVESHAQALISGRARDALLEIEKIGQLFVGDAERIFRDAIPDRDEADTGWFSSGMDDKRVAAAHAGMGLDIDGDEQTVTHRVKDKVLDPENLEKHVEAVVTLAEVYEEVQREDRPSR